MLTRRAHTAPSPVNCHTLFSGAAVWTRGRPSPYRPEPAKSGHSLKTPPPARSRPMPCRTLGKRRHKKSPPGYPGEPIATKGGENEVSRWGDCSILMLSAQGVSRARKN